MSTAKKVLTEVSDEIKVLTSKIRQGVYRSESELKAFAVSIEKALEAKLHSLTEHKPEAPVATPASENMTPASTSEQSASSVEEVEVVSSSSTANSAS